MNFHHDNGDLFQRPRINVLLELGIRNPEVIVSAPAGFGKTVAVSEFLKQSPARGIWQRLTVFDNIPSRFWASFIYTVSLHRKELSEELKELGFPDTLYKYVKFLRLLTKELYVDNQSVVFVFDDFHLIEDEAILKFFDLLLSANLENFCLIKITRKIQETLPHLDNLEGYPLVIDTEVLRFTEEEGFDYFKQQSDTGLASSDLSKLYSLTNGWPMALYLLNLQLKNNDGSIGEGLIDSQQTIYKLIESEIFSAYSDEEKVFFIQLSILNFCPRGLLSTLVFDENMDAPTGDNSAEILLQNNPFIIYDQTAQNYYLHQIFINFLTEKQSQVSDVSRKELLDKAAVWCKENAYFADAAEYYYQCREFEEIFEMLKGFDTNPFSKNETEFYIDYIEKIPEQCMTDNPMYRIIYAILLINNLEIEKSLSQMDIVFAKLSANEDTEENRLLMGEAYTAMGMISLNLEKNDFVEYFIRAAELLPDGSTWWKENTKLVQYSNALGVTSSQPGAIEESLNSFMRGMPYVSKVLNGAGFGLEYLASAEASYLIGDMKKAQKYAFDALYKAQERGQFDIEDNSLYLLLRVFLINGDIKNIEETLVKLRKSEASRDVDAQSVADIALCWFYSDIEQISEISNWIFYVGEGNESLISMDKDILLRVRCLIQEQRYFEALAFLDKVENFYIKKNTFISRIYIHVYRSVTYYGMGDDEHAFKSMKSAYDLSCGNNIIIPFIEFGNKTRSIFRNMITSEFDGIDSEWLETIHAKASTYAKRHAYIVKHFAEKSEGNANEFNLSPREKELLSNLSQGLTREEIAESMYISPHTVKSMAKTVYNKIGAINNADAVRIASASKII